MAGIFAFRDAMEKASPQLLEPMMKVEVETPDEYQGDIMGDLNRRAADTKSLVKPHSFQFLRSCLQEMFGYATIVRSLSRVAPLQYGARILRASPQIVLNTILETSTRGRY